MQTVVPARVIGGVVVPRNRIATVLLVGAFAALTAVAAQIRVPLPFTPVPLTGQTFAVLLSGAALGAYAGAASQLLYVVAGLFLPVYAGGAGGWQHATGATGGFLIGFVMAAWLIGKLAERSRDRSVATAVPMFAMGTMAIFVPGVLWLAFTLDVSLVRAIELGVTPFLVGDIVKAVLAGIALPATWRLVDRTFS